MDAPCFKNGAVNRLHMLVLAWLLLPLVVAGKDVVGYEVRFEGTLSKPLRTLLSEASLAVDLQRVGSVSPRILRVRAEKDLERFAAVLQSQGHFGYHTAFDLVEDPAPARLVFQVISGAVYTIGSIQTSGLSDEPDLPSLGAAASTARLRAVGEFVLTGVKNLGYPWARLVDTRLEPDHGRHVLSVTCVIEPGPQANLGGIHLEGLKRVKHDHIESKIKLKPGERFRLSRLTELQKDIVDTGLFNSVQVGPGKGPDADGSAAVWVQLQELRYRTLFAGVSYEADRGVGGNAGFEHLNLFGRGEQVSTRLAIDDISLAWRNQYSKPDFIRQRQTLSGKLDALEESTDAFDSKTYTLGTGLSRPFGPRSRASLGVALEENQVEQEGVDRDFLLVLTPATFDRNTSGSLLDPRHGYAISLKAAPYWNLRSEDVFFFKTQVGARHYFPLREQPALTLATRMVVGSLNGTTLENIPANERFFAGGGGSVRGYRFQSVGPLSESNTPIGGMSLMEASVELRATLVGAFGGVLFYDAASVGTDAVPGRGASIQEAVGAGLRYQTPLGPIRADLGFPLDRRPDLDRAWQFYLSLGQAF
ncbi:MAG: translocation and assembly module TamA [Kiritimatiellia bacterium]|jgi:translocation and assembly module TamA